MPLKFSISGPLEDKRLLNTYKKLQEIEVLLIVLDKAKMLYDKGIIKYEEYANAREGIENRIRELFNEIVKVLELPVKGKLGG